MGRKTLWNIEDGNRIVEMIENGNWKIVAARAVGINRTVLEKWLEIAERDEADPAMADWAKRFREAEARCESNCVSMIAGACAQGDLAAGQWLLERRFPKRWGRRERIDSKISQKLDINGKSVEELVTMLRSAGWTIIPPPSIGTTEEKSDATPPK